MKKCGWDSASLVTLSSLTWTMNGLTMKEQQHTDKALTSFFYSCFRLINRRWTRGSKSRAEGQDVEQWVPPAQYIDIPPLVKIQQYCDPLSVPTATQLENPTTQGCATAAHNWPNSDTQNRFPHAAGFVSHFSFPSLWLDNKRVAAYGRAIAWVSLFVMFCVRLIITVINSGCSCFHLPVPIYHFHLQVLLCKRLQQTDFKTVNPLGIGYMSAAALTCKQTPNCHSSQKFVYLFTLNSFPVEVITSNSLPL